MSWRKVRLGDILIRRRDSTKIIPHEKYKLVTIKLYHKGVVLRNIVNGEDIKSSMSIIRAGDFILSGIDARNGAFGIVPEELDGAVVTNDFWCLDPVKDLTNKEFLLFLTTTDFFDNICKRSSDGTTQRIRLQKDKFFNYEIVLPGILEQGTLINQLKKIKFQGTELLSELTHQLNLVKKLRQQLLQDAVQGKLVEQDPNDESASVLLKKIKAEKEQLIKDKKLKKEKELPLIKPEEIPFNIPENWIWCRMGETGNLKRGKSKHRPRNDEELFMGGTYPFIQTGDVSKAKNNQDLITTINGYYNEFGLKQSEIQSKGTLCITIAANIAECGFLNFDACVPDSIVCFQAIDNIIEKYVYYYLKIAKEHLEKFAPATAQKNINLGILNDLPFPFPPLNEQYRIIQKVEELMQMCSNLEASIKQSQLQNEQLLQQVLREALTKEAKPQSPSIKEDIPETKTSEQYAALLLAAEIIWQLNQKKTLGHIKLQKLIYLCNRTQQMNLPVNFLKQAMGPYDPKLQRYLDKELTAREWFQYSEDEPLKYKMLKKAGGHKTDYKKYFAGKTEEINHLVQLFENSRSAQIEIVATLFWCWDEMLTNNQLVNDAALLACFYKWSEFKGKYSNEKVIDALRWMEGQGIMPKIN
ncbi:MAG: restriction endonuclease subunit S [Mucilaginibacter sp.]